MASVSAEEFDRHLRRVAPDRWLASRLIGDPAARGEVLALYALDDELAKVAPAVSQPMLGQIRLQWWREALERAASGGAAEHPVVEALAPAVRAGRLATEALDSLIDAHVRELEPEAFADEAALVAWIDARFGAVMASAARMLATGADPAHVIHAARAWGWSEVPRLAVAWEARGGALQLANGSIDAASRVRAALLAARAEVKALPTAAFPAAAYATLALRRAEGRAPSELRDRVALVWAAARGAV